MFNNIHRVKIVTIGTSTITCTYEDTHYYV